MLIVVGARDRSFPESELPPGSQRLLGYRGKRHKSGFRRAEKRGFGQLMAQYIA